MYLWEEFRTACHISTNLNPLAASIGTRKIEMARKLIAAQTY